MGFWSKFGKIAKIAAPVAASFAIPGVGGMLTKMGMGAVGKAVGQVGSSGLLDKIGQMAGAGGAAVSAYGANEASNRGTAADMAMAEENFRHQAEGHNQGAEALRQNAQNNYFSQMVQREQEGRLGMNDAYSNSVKSNYTLNPDMPASARHTPTRSEGQTTAATAMAGKALERIQGGNPLPMPVQGTPYQSSITGDFRFDPRLSQAGTGEKVANIAGPALTVWGMLEELRRKQSAAPTAPPAGVGTGGVGSGGGYGGDTKPWQVNVDEYDDDEMRG